MSANSFRVWSSTNMQAAIDFVKYLNDEKTVLTGLSANLYRGFFLEPDAPASQMGEVEVAKYRNTEFNDRTLSCKWMKRRYAPWGIRTALTKAVNDMVLVKNFQVRRTQTYRWWYPWGPYRSHFGQTFPILQFEGQTKQSLQLVYAYTD